MLKKLYNYIEVNRLWETIKSIRSSYDDIVDDVYYDLEYNNNFQFSSDMSHIRTIAHHGWKKYLDEFN